MTAELVYWNPLHTSTACIAKSWFGVRGGQGPLSSYPDTWLESECQGGIVFRACRARFVEPDFLRDPLQLTQTTLANRSEGFSGVCSQKAAVSYFAVFTAMSSFLLCLSDIQKLLTDNLKWKIIHGKLATKVINKWSVPGVAARGIGECPVSYQEVMPFWRFVLVKEVPFASVEDEISAT